MQSRLQRNEFWFVLSIPVINAIAANTTGFLPNTALNPGAIRGLIIGLFSIYFIFNRLTKSSLNSFVLFYLVYFFILVILSSNFFFSLDLYLKLFIGVMMLPIGYYYFNTPEKISLLLKSFFVALVIYIINIAISNTFKLGSSDYLDDSFYFGTGRVNITKSLLLLVFFAPLTITFKRNKLLTTLIFILGLLIALIGIKRSVLLSGFIAFVIYAYFKRNKTKLIKASIALAIFVSLILIAFPSYIDTFLARFEAREERIEVTDESLEEEARYNETFQVTNEWLNGSIKHKLIGSELFNDRYYYNTHRMLHTDYMIILNGAGIVGIVLWFLIYVLIIYKKNKYYKYLKNDNLYREMNALFYMFLSAQIIMSVSSTVYAIDIRSIFFLYWGAMISIMRTRYIELTTNRNVNNEMVYY